MSLRAITWAIEEADCPSAHATLVLIIYANFANEHGRAYPSTETVAAKSRQNIKTVRASIDALEAVGLLQDTGRRVGRTGNVKVYRLAMEAHPEVGVLKGETKPDAAGSPVEAAQEAAKEALPETGGFDGGAKAPVSGVKGTRKRVAEPVSGTITPEDAIASSAPKGENNEKRYFVIEWSVPPIADLPAAVRAIAEQWPAGAYETEAAGHAAYLRGKRPGRGRQHDPDATWHARIVALGAKPLRDARAGLKHATVATSTEASVVALSEERRAGIERGAAMLEKMGRGNEADEMRRNCAVGG
jgi:hypothetical protein